MTNPSNHQRLAPLRAGNSESAASVHFGHSGATPSGRASVGAPHSGQTLGSSGIGSCYPRRHPAATANQQPRILGSRRRKEADGPSSESPRLACASQNRFRCRRPASPVGRAIRLLTSSATRAGACRVEWLHGPSANGRQMRAETRSELRWNIALARTPGRGRISLAGRTSRRALTRSCARIPPLSVFICVICG
jgi:hypothetical protein